MIEPGMVTPDMAASRTASLRLNSFTLPAEKIMKQYIKIQG